MLQITPDYGLSWVKAIGLNIATSVYGYELVTGFDAMEARLSAVYGRGKRTNLLLHGSVWNEPRDWMAAVLAHERILMTEWASEYGSSLKDDLVSVGLVASALDDSSGHKSVEYYFANAEVADARLAALEDGAP